MSKFLKTLKDLPFIDLGTGSKRHSTKSKQIALYYAQKFYQANAKALDLGCGDGYWSEKLKQIGYQTTSVDSEKRYKDIQIINANKPLPFPDNSFDLVWSLEVIEHLDKPEQVFQEIKRVLKPNGHFILTTPNSFFWLYSFFKIFNLTPQDLQRPDHQHFFHLKDIQKLFPESQIFGYFPYTRPLKFKIKNPWTLNHLSPTFIIINSSLLSQSQTHK